MATHIFLRILTWPEFAKFLAVALWCAGCLDDQQQQGGGGRMSAEGTGGLEGTVEGMEGRVGWG